MIVNNFLTNFGHCGDHRNRAIIAWIINFTFFEYGDHFCKFPLQWENARNDRSLVDFSEG